MDRLRSNRVPAELMRVDACQDAALVAMTLHLRERERVKAPSGRLQLVSGLTGGRAWH